MTVEFLHSGVRNAVKNCKEILFGNSYRLREFRGICSGVAEDSALQRRDVLPGKMVPTVRGNLTINGQNFQDIYALYKNILRCLARSEFSYPTTHRSTT